MSAQARRAIETHALQCYPNEACGLIVRDAYLPCANIARSPAHEFEISGVDYARAEDRGEILAVVHSHPDRDALPSVADLAASQASGIASWIIVSVFGTQDGRAGRARMGRWHGFRAYAQDVPLIGAPFVHGASDCYGLVRRYYRAALGADLPDFARSGRWWNDGHRSLYVENYAAAGFVSVAPEASLHVGDVLLMAIASRHGTPNHAAVYLGDDEILHHLWNQLSRREPLPRYRAHITHVLRHRETLEWNR